MRAKIGAKVSAKTWMLIVIALIAVALAGCAQNTQKAQNVQNVKQNQQMKLVHPGNLTIGMDATYPPFEFINDT